MPVSAKFASHAYNFTITVIIFSSKAGPPPSHLWRNVLIICPGEMKVSLIQVEQTHGTLLKGLVSPTGAQFQTDTRAKPRVSFLNYCSPVSSLCLCGSFLVQLDVAHRNHRNLQPRGPWPAVVVYQA